MANIDAPSRLNHKHHKEDDSPMLTILSGDGQSAPGLSTFANPIEVLITDKLSGQALSSKDVIFTLTTPAGSDATAQFDSSSDAGPATVFVATSSNDGIATCASIELGSKTGNIQVSAKCGSSHTATFTLTVLPPVAFRLQPQSGDNQSIHSTDDQQFESLVVGVFDLDNNPIDEASVVFQIQATNPSNAFAFSGGGQSVQVATVSGVATSPSLIIQRDASGNPLALGAFQVVASAPASPMDPRCIFTATLLS